MQLVRSSLLALALGLVVSGAIAGETNDSATLTSGPTNASLGHDSGDGSSGMGEAFAVRPLPRPRPLPEPFPYPYPKPPLPKPWPPIPPTGPIH